MRLNATAHTGTQAHRHAHTLETPIGNSRPVKFSGTPNFSNDHFCTLLFCAGPIYTCQVEGFLQIFKNFLFRLQSWILQSFLRWTTFSAAVLSDWNGSISFRRLTSTGYVSRPACASTAHVERLDIAACVSGAALPTSTGTTLTS